ncbi:MAG: CDP-glucose 4,6-dehydratase [Selenomonadaceae bacterium]|nr:CDP-glucose 4,6-dehydratase [Selenomonadaceae bacterium]
MINKSFWKDKKVFLTGHSGFKGAWLAFMLKSFGAVVKGYSLPPATSPNLFDTVMLDKLINSVTGDIRDLENMRREFDTFNPEIVFHLAAQPLVLEGYKNPADTYSTNVMGTVNILECVRQNDSVRSFINVTTDKVYHNNEWCYGYRETDILDGIDPYSNSKSCSELVTACYVRSFLSARNVAVSTMRAGNVIGGGDFAENRIIPDCVRAAIKGNAIEVRNPNSVRPYQHVLDALFAYMLVAQRQYEDKSLAGSYNVAPSEDDTVTTGELTELFCKSWGENLNWESKSLNQPKEANLLKLDCSKLKAVFDWQPKWNIKTAVDKSVEWYKIYRDGEDVTFCMKNQIEEFLRGNKHESKRNA